jgi:hypothetical protein
MAKPPVPEKENPRVKKSRRMKYEQIIFDRYIGEIEVIKSMFFRLIKCN